MGEEVEFEKMLLTNGAVLEIIVSKSIWGNIEWELIVSIALLTESENSYFNKSIIKSSVQKILLQDFFCSFNNDGELKSFVKSFIWSVRCLYIQPIMTLVDFEQMITIKVDSIFPGW